MDRIGVKPTIKTSKKFEEITHMEEGKEVDCNEHQPIMGKMWVPVVEPCPDVEMSDSDNKCVSLGGTEDRFTKELDGKYTSSITPITDLYWLLEESRKH